MVAFVSQTLVQYMQPQHLWVAYGTIFLLVSIICLTVAFGVKDD